MCANTCPKKSCRVGFTREEHAADQLGGSSAEETLGRVVEHPTRVSTFDANVMGDLDAFLETLQSVFARN